MQLMTRVGPTEFVQVTSDIAEHIGGSIGARHYKCEGEMVCVDGTQDAPVYGARRLWFCDKETGIYFVSKSPIT